MNCELCKGKGFVNKTDDQGYERLEPCKCSVNKLIDKELIRAGLDSSNASKTFQTYNADTNLQKHLKGKCIAYAKNPKGWLSILGQSDTGKTHLGIATAKNIVALNYGVDYKAKYLIWTDFTTTFEFGTVDKNEYNEIVNADLLYIDDLLKAESLQDLGKTEKKIAWSIINARYLSDKITIITSEWTADDFIAIDFAFGRRIIERSGDNLLQIKKDRKRSYNLGGIE